MSRKDKMLFIEDLWRSEKDKLWRHAYLLLHDKELASEAVMDTFETAVKKMDTLYTHELPPAWLMTTLNYKVQNIRAREAYQKKLYSEATTPLDRSLLEILPAAMKPEDTKLLELYYGQQFSLGEISKRMGTSKSKLGYRLFQLRKQLKNIFTDDKSNSKHKK